MFERRDGIGVNVHSYPVAELVRNHLRAEEVYEGRAEFETGETDSAILQP
jgi:hypothetical protein